MSYTYGDARQDIAAALDVLTHVSDPNAPTLKATFYSLQLNITDTSSYPDQMDYPNVQGLGSMIQTTLQYADAASYNSADASYSELIFSKAFTFAATANPQPTPGVSGGILSTLTGVDDPLGALGDAASQGFVGSELEKYALIGGVVLVLLLVVYKAA